MNKALCSSSLSSTNRISLQF
uniref:Uncharacterized protein n=1 Tax=Arundo donax TaxID=35708 RepID=A0A0A8Z4T1_ARUDO